MPSITLCLTVSKKIVLQVKGDCFESIKLLSPYFVCVYS